MARRAVRKLTLGTAFAGVLGLAACSSGTGTPGSSAPAAAGAVTSATIKVLVNVTPTLTQSFWNNQARLFEKQYPKVTVKLENQGGEDLDTYFSSLVSAGNAPDVAEGLGGIGTLAHDGVLAAYPKASWITSEADWQEQTVNGTIYAPSAALQAQSIVFYNKNDFTKAGISSAPTTMAALKTDVARLKAKGIAPFQAGSQFVTGAQLSSLVAPTLFQQNPSWFAQRNSNKVTFGNSYWKTMLATYQGWVRNKDFAPGALSTPYAQSETDFLKGQAAMYVMGSYVTPTIDSTPHSFGVGVFAVPTQSGKPALAVAPTLNFEIMKSSPHYADDLAFAKFMETNSTAVRNFIKADGDYSAVTPPITYPQSALSTQIQKIVDSGVTLTPCCTGSGSNSASQEFGNELTQQVQALFTGSENPAQIASTLDTWWSRQGGAG
ncbi:MAG TPA: extracellular solute-binding protein [Streptosporangiaceae bacterium]|nr:extracellular solute-binding protein [Streptosporangiaceae bacterium]